MGLGGAFSRDKLFKYYLNIIFLNDVLKCCKWRRYYVSVFKVIVLLRFTRKDS